MGGQFVPLVVRLSENVNAAEPSEILVKLAYNGGFGSVFRVWTKDAGAQRSELDILEPSGFGSTTYYDLGLEPGGSVTLYIEALQASPCAMPITVTAQVTGSKWSGTLSDTVHVVVPEVDLDTDSNNDGTIDLDNNASTGTDDPIEDKQDLPGRILAVNNDDDDNNGTADKDDVSVAGEDDLAEVRLHASVGGAENVSDWDVTLKVPEADLGKIRLYGSNTKENPYYFQGGGDGTWCIPFTPDSGGMVDKTLWVEGREAGTVTLDMVLKNDALGIERHDLITLCVVSASLTGYRPQTEPFARTAVPETNEDSPGVGIRLNGDDDDQDGVADVTATDTNIAGENDLIEVELALPTVTGVRYRIESSNDNLRVWAGQTKSGEYHVDGTYDLTPASETLTIWVEWVEADLTQTADLELQVWDAVHNNQALVVDTLHFYPFQSVVIVLGGEGQVPADPPDNNHGTFLVGRALYLAGYDVHMFDEDVVNNAGAGVAFDEIVQAVQRRGVTQVAILGYSHGGGSTFDLAQRLHNQHAAIGVFTVRFTSYVDAVQNDSDVDVEQEVRRPVDSLYHINQYQHGTAGDGWLDGGPTAAPDVADWELDVETTAWGANATHFDVDDLEQVRNEVITRLQQRVDR